MPYKATDPKILFDKKIVKEPDGCWSWTGAKHKVGGHGVFGFRGQCVTAWRAAYVIYVGEIPAGKKIVHKCPNKHCVNPEHLELVGHDFRHRN